MAPSHPGRAPLPLLRGSDSSQDLLPFCPACGFWPTSWRETSMELAGSLLPSARLHFDALCPVSPAAPSRFQGPGILENGC